MPMKVRESGNGVSPGMRFGRLVVQGWQFRDHNGSYRVVCDCDCGEKAVPTVYHLNDGKVASCGCYRLERLREETVKHGETKTRLYGCWTRMLGRCRNPNIEKWNHYGGKGVKVCDEWIEFETFRDWALENGYQDELEIDRLDNNGNYEPSNCRWATRQEQIENRSCSIMITHNGRTQTAGKWADELGISRSTMYSRLNRYGWDPIKAITEPVKGGL